MQVLRRRIVPRCARYPAPRAGNRDTDPRVRHRPRGYRAPMTSDDRRSGRDRDWTDTESEGMPATEDTAPGMGPETALEGDPLPGDHPVASTEYGVSAREEAEPETLRARVARERPDLPQIPPDDPGGRIAQGATDDDEPAEAEWAGDDAGLSAEEAAVHVERP